MAECTIARRCLAVAKTAHSWSCRSHRGCRPEEDVAEKLDSASGVADRGDDRVQRLVPVDSLYVRTADGLEELKGSFFLFLMPPVLAPHQSSASGKKGSSWKAAEREPGRCTFLAKCSLPFVTIVPKRRVGAGVARASSAGGAVNTSQVSFGDFSMWSLGPSIMSSCPPSFENWANHPAGVSEILDVSVGAEGSHAHHASLLPFTLQGQTQGSVRKLPREAMVRRVSRWERHFP